MNHSTLKFVLTASILFSTSAFMGCDEKVSEETKVKKDADGRTVTEKETVTKNADGSVTKTKEQNVDPKAEKTTKVEKEKTVISPGGTKQTTTEKKVE